MKYGITLCVRLVMTAAILSQRAQAEATPDQDTLVKVVSEKGSIRVVAGKHSEKLTPGPGYWDWMPKVSPNANYVAFLRQDRGQTKRLHLCLLRLEDEKVTTLRTAYFGVPLKPTKGLRLEWVGDTLKLSNGKTWSKFDLRGRKIATSGAKRVLSRSAPKPPSLSPPASPPTH